MTSMASMTTRVRPAGFAERIAAAFGMRALRWSRTQANARTREAIAGVSAHERAVQRREHEWSRLEAIRPR